MISTVVLVAPGHIHVIAAYLMQISEVNTYMHSYNNDRGIGCPQEFFQGGGANLWGGAKKYVKECPHNFLDKL